MNTDMPDISKRRRKARNTAFLLGVVVALFYVGFIAVGVLRS